MTAGNTPYLFSFGANGDLPPVTLLVGIIVLFILARVWEDSVLFFCGTVLLLFVGIGGMMS